jgi:hypothetical protein
MTATHILPCKGRWQAEGLTEGYRPLVNASPLRRAAARHLLLQRRIDD